MPLIVDTYNVLHVAGVLPAEMAGIDTSDLIDMIADSRYASHAVALVCDGRPRDDAPEGDFGSIRVMYSGPNASADDVITRMVARSTAPRDLLIITADRALATLARRRGCKVMRSDVFLQRIGQDAQRRRGSVARPMRKPQVPLPPGEVDMWLRVFGLSDRDLTRSAPADDIGGINLDAFFEENRTDAP